MQLVHGGVSLCQLELHSGARLSSHSAACRCQSRVNPTAQRSNRFRTAHQQSAPCATQQSAARRRLAPCANCTPIARIAVLAVPLRSRLSLSRTLAAARAAPSRRHGAAWLPPPSRRPLVRQFVGAETQGMGVGKVMVAHGREAGRVGAQVVVGGVAVLLPGHWVAAACEERVGVRATVGREPAAGCPPHCERACVARRERGRPQRRQRRCVPRPTRRLVAAPPVDVVQAALQRRHLRPAGAAAGGTPAQPASHAHAGHPRAFAPLTPPPAHRRRFCGPPPLQLGQHGAQVVVDLLHLARAGGGGKQARRWRAQRASDGRLAGGGRPALPTRPIKSTAQPPLSVTTHSCCGWMWACTKARPFLRGGTPCDCVAGARMAGRWAAQAASATAAPTSKPPSPTHHRPPPPPPTPTHTHPPTHPPTQTHVPQTPPRPPAACRVGGAHVGEAVRVGAEGGPRERGGGGAARRQLARHHAVRAHRPLVRVANLRDGRGGGRRVGCKAWRPSVGRQDAKAGRPGGQRAASGSQTSRQSSRATGRPARPGRRPVCGGWMGEGGARARVRDGCRETDPAAAGAANPNTRARALLACSGSKASALGGAAPLALARQPPKWHSSEEEAVLAWRR